MNKLFTMEKIPFVSNNPNTTLKLQYAELVSFQDQDFDKDNVGNFKNHNVFNIPEGYRYDFKEVEDRSFKNGEVTDSDDNEENERTEEDSEETELIEVPSYLEMSQGQGYDLERGLSLYAIQIKPKFTDSYIDPGDEEKHQSVCRQFERALKHCTRPFDFANGIASRISDYLIEEAELTDEKNFNTDHLMSELRKCRESEFPLYVFGRELFPDIQLARLQRDIVELVARKLENRFEDLINTIEYLAWLACKLFLFDGIGTTEVNDRLYGTALFCHPSSFDHPFSYLVMIDNASAFDNIVFHSKFASMVDLPGPYSIEYHYSKLREATKLAHSSILRRIAVAFNNLVSEEEDGIEWKMSFSSSDPLDSDELEDLFDLGVDVQDLFWPQPICFYTTNSLRKEPYSYSFSYYNYCLSEDDINRCGMILWSSMEKPDHRNSRDLTCVPLSPVQRSKSRQDGILEYCDLTEEETRNRPCLHIQVGTNALTNNEDEVLTQEEQSAVFWEHNVWTLDQHAKTVSISLTDMGIGAIPVVGAYNEDFSKNLEIKSSRVISQSLKALQKKTRPDGIGDELGNWISRVESANPFENSDFSRQYHELGPDEDQQERNYETEEGEEGEDKKSDLAVSGFSNFSFPLLFQCKFINSPLDGRKFAPFSKILAEIYTEMKREEEIIEGLEETSSEVQEKQKVVDLRQYTYSSIEFYDWLASYISFLPCYPYLEPPSTSSIYDLHRSALMGVIDHFVYEIKKSSDPETLKACVDDYDWICQMTPEPKSTPLEFGFSKGEMTLRLTRSLVREMFCNADLIENSKRGMVITQSNALLTVGSESRSMFFGKLMGDLTKYYSQSSHSFSYKHFINHYHSDRAMLGEDIFLIFLTKMLELEIVRNCMTVDGIILKFWEKDDY